jgi:hypothetical protein
MGRRVTCLKEQLGHGTILLPADLIPPHMRNLEAVWQIKTHHLAGKNTQAIVPASLPASFKQELQAHADSKEGSVRREMLLDRLNETAFPKRDHGICKGTNTGKTSLSDSAHQIRVGSYFRSNAQPLESLLNAPQVAATVVDDPEHLSSVSRRTTRKRGGLFSPKRLALFNQI